jgi:hypothetical protein
MGVPTQTGNTRAFVMAGLVPAIHGFLRQPEKQDTGKRAHDA